MESFLSNENKSVLWGVLQENQTFQGIDNNQFDEIKNLFENTVIKQSKNFNGSLLELNKKTISELINTINNYKKKPKISMIYKAEDIQNERQNVINEQFKKQQDDMNMMLNPKKPGEVNFSDDLVDKPLGSDLERSIAEMMASRERQLEQIPQNKNVAENWITNGGTGVSGSTSSNDNKIKSVKNVTFNETTETKIIDNNEMMNNAKMENFDIFSKLKKKTENIPSTPLSVSNETIYNEILSLKKSIEEIKTLLTDNKVQEIIEESIEKKTEEIVEEITNNN